MRTFLILLFSFAGGLALSGIVANLYRILARKPQSRADQRGVTHIAEPEAASTHRPDEPIQRSGPDRAQATAQQQPALSGQGAGQADGGRHEQPAELGETQRQPGRPQIDHRQHDTERGKNDPRRLQAR